MCLDGSAAQLTVTSGHTVAFDILVVGRTSASESGGYSIQGLIENVGGNTTLIGSSVTTIAEDDAEWDAQVVADNANHALKVQVRGNLETIRWVATVRALEVGW
ncbi:MAG: hypothetical protein ACOC7N_03840 [Chloroflexota bacterium]